MVFDYGHMGTGSNLVRVVNYLYFTHYGLRRRQSINLLLINPAECSIVLKQIICEHITISIQTYIPRAVHYQLTYLEGELPREYGMAEGEGGREG